MTSVEVAPDRFGTTPGFIWPVLGAVVLVILTVALYRYLQRRKYGT
jgi:hypothetical protein